MIGSIAANAAEIRDRVTRAAEASGRDPQDVTIVAVSKTFPRELIDEAYSLGFRTFAESRVQEIAEKFSNPLPPDAAIHMIGPLQTNKIRALLPHIHVLQTLDRARLIDALAKELNRNERALDVLLQVNVSGEEQKSGIAPDAVHDIIQQARDAGSINPIGFMSMAPLGADEATLHSVFGGLRELRDRAQDAFGISLPMLSMGMSDDFEVAIAEGATHVRIGRALFGSR